MKVALNARFYTQRVTGVQRYARELSREVAAGLSRTDFEAIAPRGAAPEEVAYPLRRRGRFAGHAWEQLELPNLVPSDADILWSPCNVGPVAVRRQVVTLHDVFSITRPEWVSRKFHHWYRLLLPLLTRRVRHVITVSEWSRSQIIEALALPSEKVTVIAEGVGRQFTPPGEEATRELRRHYQLPDEYILALGSIEPRKNLKRTIRAWSTLPPQSRVPLVIAGGLGDARVFGNYDDERLFNRPDVHRLGYVPDEHLPALYGNALLLAYVPLEEGFGLPPIEALACGTEVVTSATSALAEYCGPYATLVDPESSGAISAGLEAALASLKPSVVRSERAAEVRRRFDWGVAARETIDVLAAAARR